MFQSKQEQERNNMDKKINPPRVICYGELLWDNLPTGRMAGGAPMNVAYHLNRLGAESQMITRTGEDQAGAGLIAFSSEIGLPIANIQIDHTHPTGEVIATIMANEEVVYDILPDAAWDFIAFQPNFSELAAAADAFVFGSLAARSSGSRETLFRLIDAAKYRVFDINLRAPHYSKEILHQLLSKADLLKLNNDELILLNSLFFVEGSPEKDTMSFLLQTYEITEIILTKGSEGASYFTADEHYTGKAYPVKVADTVGAGDSFLAAFLYKKFTGAPVSEAFDYARAMGAFIAGKKGGCPPYSVAELEQFIAENHSL